VRHKAPTLQPKQFKRGLNYDTALSEVV